MDFQAGAGWWVLGLAILLTTPPSIMGQAPPPLLIRDVTLVDGTGAPSRDGVDVEFRDGVVASIRATSGPSDFDGRVIEGEGRYLIPGLIDAHVHISGSPHDETAALMKWALEGGVTTLRDMAGDARDLAGIQQAQLRGELDGPRVFYSTLMAGPAFMSDPRLRNATVGHAEGQAPYMIALTPETDIVRAVAMAKGTGATGIKLYAALDDALIAAVIAEAHQQGLLVWGHSAIFPAKPTEIVEAGVDGVSHAPYVIWDAAPPTDDFELRARGDFGAVAPDSPAMLALIERMVKAGTVLDPTLFVFDRGLDDPMARARLDWGARFTGLANEAGVLLAAGTDGIGQPIAGALPNVHQELELLVRLAGLSPQQALMAGTRGGATVLRMEDRLGTLEVGKAADAVLLSRDPTEDIRNTRHIVHVMQGGRVVR